MSTVNEIEVPYITKWTSVGDAQKIWRRYGWRPPTEYRDDYLFGQNRDDVIPNDEHFSTETQNG